MPKVPTIYQVEVCEMNGKQCFIVRSADPTKDVLVTLDFKEVADFMNVTTLCS